MSKKKRGRPPRLISVRIAANGRYIEIKVLGQHVSRCPVNPSDPSVVPSCCRIAASHGLRIIQGSPYINNPPISWHFSPDGMLAQKLREAQSDQERGEILLQAVSERLQIYVGISGQSEGTREPHQSSLEVDLFLALANLGGTPVRPRGSPPPTGDWFARLAGMGKNG